MVKKSGSPRLFFGAAEGTHDGRELNLQRTQLHVGGNPGGWTKMD
jgi:hypothetical protein